MLVLAVAVLVGACGSAAVHPRPDDGKDGFRFVGGGTAHTARLIQPDLFWSADGEVQRFPDGYRGTWRGEPVDLRVHDGLIEGFVGSLRTELHLEPQEHGFFVRGIYRMQLGELWIGEDKIEGRIGVGTVSVVRVDARSYGGVMPERAGAPLRRRVLTVPEGFRNLPREEQALYLALLLGG